MTITPNDALEELASLSRQRGRLGDPPVPERWLAQRLQCSPEELQRVFADSSLNGSVKRRVDGQVFYHLTEEGIRRQIRNPVLSRLTDFEADPQVEASLAAGTISPQALAEALLSMAGMPPLAEHIPNEVKRARALEIVKDSLQDIESIKQPLGSAQIADALNRCLLSLSIEPISESFASVVLPQDCLRNETVLSNTIKKIRIVSMLEFGSFSSGYKNLSSIGNREDLQTIWRRASPSTDSSALTGRRLNIQRINGHNLWVLGYVAESDKPKINSVRQNLLPVLRDALSEGVANYQSLQALAKRKGLQIESQLMRSSLSVNLYQEGLPPYKERLERAASECEEVTPDHIKKLRAQARRNTNVYMTTEDLDVYLATSMRDPWDFTTQSSLVQRVFDEGELADKPIRFFDPTQAFTHDRLDKGLLECLSIMRSKVVLYNAQEQDTFGKDSEIAFGLCLGKSAVIYVARLFGSDPAFSTVYTFIDDNRGCKKDELIANAYRRPLNWDFDSAKEPDLWRHATEAEVIGDIVSFRLKKQVERKTSIELLQELKLHGYDFIPSQGVAKEDEYHKELVQYVMDRISKLERRAFVFTEAHPLSLQTSPFDGVARGVMVVRSVEMTRKVILAILTDGMDYRLDESDSQDYCYILRDGLTSSPVRIVTKDPVLTTAFWATFRRQAKVRLEKMRQMLD